MELTSEEKDIMLHALGASSHKAKLGFRNYYCTNQNDTRLENLVEKGMMRRGYEDGVSRYYHVTTQGIKELGLPEDTLSYQD